MQKRIVSVCLALLFILGVTSSVMGDVRASEDVPLLDGSYLTYDEESIGYAYQLTRGVDLLTGYSKVVRMGPGEIYAGGTTIAAHTVDRVKISVMIERVSKEGEAWEFYDGWRKENTNADRVSANRGLKVEGGYYYRVRCTHSANDDVSSSFTDGVFVEEPGILSSYSETSK